MEERAFVGSSHSAAGVFRRAGWEPGSRNRRKGSRSNLSADQRKRPASAGSRHWRVGFQPDRGNTLGPGDPLKPLNTGVVVKTTDHTEDTEVFVKLTEASASSCTQESDVFEKAVAENQAGIAERHGGCASHWRKERLLVHHIARPVCFGGRGGSPGPGTGGRDPAAI